MEIRSLSIRSRLVLLTLGLVVPFMLAGFVNLWNFRQASRAQLDRSLEQQAKLAARAFEQSITAHQQTLETVSMLSMSGESNFTLKDYLDSIVKTRPAWLDIQIVDRNGGVVLAQSAKPPNLPAGSVKAIREDAERENAFVISTEESPDRTTGYLSLALPVANQNFVVARLSGSSVSDVFEKLDLPDDNLIALFDKDNRLLYRNHGVPEQVAADAGGTPLFTALREKHRGVIEVESPYDGVERIYGLAPVGATSSVVAIGVPSSRLYEATRLQLLRQTLFSLFIAALAMLAAFVIARSITKPMRRLTHAAKDFGGGDLTARTEVAQGGVVRELSLTFNQMAEEIERRERGLKDLDNLKSEFVGNVSHELRTPLTTIKTLTRILQSNRLPDAERKEYLKTIAAECDRQIEFVQTLLDLSRIESGAYPVRLTGVDVGELLSECVEAQNPAAGERGLDLSLVLPGGENITVSTDAGVLRRVVTSLVENAMKYTPEGGKIEVSARSVDNDAVVIEIADNGCGIAAEDLPRIFERFFRGRPLSAGAAVAGDNVLEDDLAQANEKSGTGLGLYMVDGLVRQVGATIEAESPNSNTGQGTKFILTLPVGEAA